MNRSESTSKRRVTFVGPLPPPVTGMTAMSEVIVHALQQQGPITCYNWSRNRPVQGLRWKLTRAWGFIKTCFGLLASGRRRGGVLYYPVNSSWGLLYDITLAGLGRLLGYRIVLHHHVYAYLDQHDRRMALINTLIGARGVHAVHCQKMVEDFQRQYETQAEFLIVPPTIVSQGLGKGRQALPAAARPRQPFVLGFLSNLTFAKGLQEVLGTFESLLNRGLDIRLILAGPCLQQDALSLVEQASNKWPERVEYRGPVYDDQKVQFYSDIEAFLFPTKYKNESWGIVLTEAMAYGRPVIANDRGCVSHIISNGCGRVVHCEEDYVAIAADLIGQWISDPELYGQASQRALERTAELEQDATEQLPAFVDQLRLLS